MANGMLTESKAQMQAAARMVRRASRVRKEGFKQYGGSPEEICRAILDDAYDKEKGYFRVSSGHFCEFYVRDFAFCAEALVQLGYKEQVDSTLRYALSRFRSAGKVTGAISPDGDPYTFPRYGPDSLALFLYTLTHTGNERLAAEHKEFLQSQADDFVKRVIDPSTMLPFAHKRFSSIRDHAKREAACYDAVMIALVARECATLSLRFPCTPQAALDALRANYWNGTYFFNDLAKQNIVVGDANVFPFWTGLFDDAAMLEQTLVAVQAAGLDQPLPLRYVSEHDKRREKTSLHAANLFAPDYETTSIWMHLGLCYVRVLSEHDPALARKHLRRITEQLLKHRTFLEVYDTHGQPFKSKVYVTDEAMLWCAMYLGLLEKLNKTQGVDESER